jgi:hypothetical protein
MTPRSFCAKSVVDRTDVRPSVAPRSHARGAGQALGDRDLGLVDAELHGPRSVWSRSRGRARPAVILVSGTIDEDIAVTALKAGAHDFMSKGRYARLLPSIAREVREAAAGSVQPMTSWYDRSLRARLCGAGALDHGAGADQWSPVPVREHYREAVELGVRGLQDDLSKTSRCGCARIQSVTVSPRNSRSTCLRCCEHFQAQHPTQPTLCGPRSPRSIASCRLRAPAVAHPTSPCDPRRDLLPGYIASAVSASACAGP